MKFESNVVQFERIHWKCDGECRRNGRNVINGRQRHLLSGGCGMRQYRPLLSFHSTRNEWPPPPPRPDPPPAMSSEGATIQRSRPALPSAANFPTNFSESKSTTIRRIGGFAWNLHRKWGRGCWFERSKFRCGVPGGWGGSGHCCQIVGRMSRKWIEFWNNWIYSEKREDSSGGVSSRSWRHEKVGQKLTRILRRRVATKFPFRRPQRPRPSAARNSAVFHLHKMQIFLLIRGVDGARQWRPLNVRSDRPTFTRWNPDTFPSNFICKHINR